MDRSLAGLRNVPRQKRSEERIEKILDAAERVVLRMGYDALTTNHVAAEAGISIGALYHWFPDKQALTDGLNARHIGRLAQQTADLIVDEPEFHSPTLIERLVMTLASFIAANPSISEIVRSSSGPGSPPGTFREVIAQRCEELIQARVPGVPEEEKKLTAEACATITLAFLCDSKRGVSDPEWTRELAYVLTAYMTGAKYPPATDPVWDAPEKAVPPPARPGLAWDPGED